MHVYSAFWRAGGVLTAALWAAKDAAIAEAAAAAGSAERDALAAALVADVLAQARADATGKGESAREAGAFVIALRAELGTFAPSGPPPPRPEWRPWCGPYLAALWAGASTAEAARRAGVAQASAFSYLKRTPSFAEACIGVREAARNFRAAPALEIWPAAWCGPYLAALRAGAPVAEAARKAGIRTLRPYVYAACRPDFAEAMRAARAAGTSPS